MPSKKPRRVDPEAESGQPNVPRIPDYDEEDEAPLPNRATRRRAARAAAHDGDGEKEELRGGWTEAQKQMESTSQWAQAFKPDENTVFIKFLDDTPYVNFKRHWIERASTTPGQRNVRAYTCLKSFDGKDCPLCSIGEKPGAVAAFNIAIVGDDGQLLRKSWDTQPRIYNVLKAYANDPKIAPLTRGFFMVSRSGASGSRSGGTVQYNISPIRASSMEEDYDMTVPTQEELDKLERYTPEIVDVPTMKQLRDLANELADEDYDD